MRLELDALLVDRAKLGQRENLESARIGEDWSIPAHELVKPAHLAYDLVAGAKVEMVGVAKDHRGAHSHEVVGVQRLYSGESSDRHERRRIDGTVRRRKNAGARGAGAALDLEIEAHAGKLAVAPGTARPQNC